MLGIEDPYVWFGYLLSLASALFCVVYGLANWHRGDEVVNGADMQWGMPDDRVEEEL